MKAFSTILTTALVLISFSSFGAIITVNSAGGAQYTALQTAMNDAAVGDTLLVSGEFSGTYYIDKELHLFGSGFGDNQGYGLPRAYVQYFRFRSVTAGVFPNGSIISGFECQYIYHINSNFDLTDVVIERNQITVDMELQYGLGTVDIRNNVIQRRIFLEGYLGINSHGAVTIENNYIEGYIQGYDHDATAVTIRNNVFADDGQETVLLNVNGATVNNNIFWRQSPGVDSAAHCDGCSFNNNIVYFVNTGTNDVYINNPISGIYGNNVGANNILFNSVSDLDDPLFVNYANPAGGNWSSTYDYQLDASSPNGVQGIGAGTDGTDIGTKGGNHPIPDKILPRIPHVTSLESLQTSVPVGGTLQVQFGATKQD